MPNNAAEFHTDSETWVMVSGSVVSVSYQAIENVFFANNELPACVEFERICRECGDTSFSRDFSGWNGGNVVGNTFFAFPNEETATAVFNLIISIL